MIVFEKVSKIYKNGVVALDNIYVDIQKGEFVFLVGASGAGKSTFVSYYFRRSSKRLEV